VLDKGDVLKSRYVVLEKIGSGGYGTVFRARDKTKNRIVAIKVLRPDLADDPDYVRRFRREGDIAELLDSRHIVRIFQTDHTRLGSQEIHFQVMEHVEGLTLQELLKRRGQLPVPEALAIAVQVARALEEAENKGVVHRDVKPKNIFIGGDDTVWLGDFGIARAVDFPSLRPDDPILGTPPYMSPEQCVGKREEIDIRSDIYSLGVVLYEMLAGRPPFEGDSPNVITYRHVHETPAPLRERVPSASHEVEELVGRCLAKRPQDRFQSPHDLRRAMERLLQAESEIGDVLAAEETQELPELAERTKAASRLLPLGNAISRIGAVPLAMTRGVASAIRSGGSVAAAGGTAVGRAAMSAFGHGVASVQSTGRRLVRTSVLVFSIPPRLLRGVFAAVAEWWRRPHFRFFVGLSSIAGGGVALAVTAAILLLGGGGGEPSVAASPTASPSTPVPPTDTETLGELAYVGADGNLWVSDADGANPQALTSHGRAAHPAWSPDASEIAYVYVDGDPANADAITAGQVATEIRVIDVETREERTVLGPIAYTDEGVARYALLRSPVWEGTGKAILYHEQRGVGNTSRIRRHPLQFADGTPMDTTDRYDGTVVQSSFLSNSSTSVSGFTLLPSEQGILFEVGAGSGGLLANQCWIEAITGQASEAMSTVVVPAVGDQCHGLPAVDPQGQQLAFYSYPGEGRGLVKVRDLETDEEWELAPAYPQSVADYPFWPKIAWSGDGQYLAYENGDNAVGQEEIFIQAAAGGEPRQFGVGRHPAWARPERSSCETYECLLPPIAEPGLPAPYVFWVVAPAETARAEPFNVIALAKNVGEAGGNGSIDMGLPEAPQVTAGPRDETFPPATVVDAGAKLSVFTSDDPCGAITAEAAKYPVIYVFGSGNRRWEAGDEHFLGVTITPGDPGGLSLNIRATIEAIMDSQRCMFTYPAESPNRDQQNMPVIQWLVQVR
jgi:hypothetical protein